MAEDYKAMARKAAEQEGVDPDLFGRLVNQESRYNPAALSPKGARGLSQLMPATAKELGVNPDDPWDNLVGGARYLGRQIKAFNGDVTKGLAAYNAGAGNVRKYNGVPPFAETRDYVKKILGDVVPENASPVPDEVATKGAAFRRASLNQTLVGGPVGSTEQGMMREKEALQFAQANRPSLLAMIGGAIAGNTDSELVRGFQRTFGQERHQPDPAFRPKLDEPEAINDRDVFDKLTVTRSQAEYDEVLQQEREANFRTKTVMDRGGALGVALSFGAEVTTVSNLVPGVAFAKMTKLASTASRMGTVGYNIAGNLAAGTAVEVTRQALNDEFKPADLFLAATLDVAFGAAFGSHAFSAGIKARAEASHALAVEHAVQKELATAEAAMAKLGPDASPEAVRAEMQAMHFAEAQAPVLGAMQDIPANRRIFATEGAQPRAQRDMGRAPVEIEAGAGSWGPFMSKTGLAERRAELVNQGAYLSDLSGGAVRSVDEIEAMSPGVKFTDKVPKEAQQAVKAAQAIAARFLGDDFRMVIHSKDLGENRAQVVQISDKAALVTMNTNLSPVDAIRSVAHEIGHMVINRNLAKLDDAMLTKLDASYKRLVAEQLKGEASGAATRSQRYSLLNPQLQRGRELPLPLGNDAYSMSRDEFSAEQFVKYMEEDWATANKTAMPPDVVSVLKDAIRKALEYLRLVKRENVGVTDEYRELFDMLADGPLPDAMASRKAGTGSMAQADVSKLNDFMTNPDAVRLGLTSLPIGTAAEKAEAGEILSLHLRAEEWAKANPMDEAWIKRSKFLQENTVFASTGLIMLSSPSPLVRMLASELLEDASGVAGKRNQTAAIAKHMFERAIQGNTKNDVQGAYDLWKKQRGFGLKDDIMGGANWKAFNREVAEEIENRAGGVKSVTKDGNVKAAADSLEAAYSRSADLQRKTGMLGADALTPDSVGYMPHVMSPKAVMAMTNGQRQTLQAALTDQYITLSGWDFQFSDALAAKVVQRARERATGGAASSFGGSSTDTLKESMEAMGLNAKEIAKRLKQVADGGASHTKKRIKLDLNRVYDTEKGPFKLMDVFDTDQITLLDHQTQRVSGEAALAKHGIKGKPGLTIIRKALEHGEDGKSPSNRDRESFDQVAAEFMGQPFGTAAPQWLTRLTTLNSAARLGGMGFNQMGEFVNAIHHVGFAATANAIVGMNRLHKEVKALARGEKVNNSILNSIELTGGAEFGTDMYKIKMPFDHPDHQLPAYGKDSITVVDRILRGATHVQAKLSFWRAIHSAQQRGMAEQIVHKLVRYARDGGEDMALRQFGISAELQAAIGADLHKIAKFQDGKLSEFDVSKMTNVAQAEELIQAVHRGVAQIIQSTFIGEQGKWVHNGYMQAAAQFRGYGIVAMEKQWGRQRNSRSTGAAFGMLLGSMFMVLPVYAARVLATSVGKENQDEYIDKAFTPYSLARASTNYTAMSGMGGDVMDLLSHAPFVPDDWAAGQNRAGTKQDFVGNYILPSSSLINDAYKVLQAPSNIHGMAKLMPGANLPGITQLVNQLPKD